MLDMKDLRMEESAREANIMVNEMPEEEEIEDAIKEVKDSSPGEDNLHKARRPSNKTANRKDGSAHV